MRGFTLVELSIVLVIIGLIVGGIVGGQSLIQSTKTQSLVKEVSQYQTAWLIFEDQYDAHPGDMLEAYDYWPGKTGCSSASKCNGDGDGKVNHYTEWFMVWPHFNHSGIYPNNLTGLRDTSWGGTTCSTSACGYHPGGNSPKTPFSGFFHLKHTTLHGLETGSYYTTRKNKTGHFLLAAEINGGTKSYPSKGIIQNTTAYNIDKKMDDSFPDAGNIYAGANGCTTTIYNKGPRDYKKDGTLCTMQFYLGN